MADASRIALERAKAAGGFAFPSGEDVSAQYAGMTLRDWFAGQALASRPAVDIPGAAEWAYKVADSMLAARDAKKPEGE